MEALIKWFSWGFLGSTVEKNLPVNAGDTRDAGLISGSGRSSGVVNDNPLQYSCQENSTKEPGRLQSIGLPKVGHDCALMHTRCVPGAGADPLGNIKREQKYFLPE